MYLSRLYVWWIKKKTSEIWEIAWNALGNYLEAYFARVTSFPHYNTRNFHSKSLHGSRVISHLREKVLICGCSRLAEMHEWWWWDGYGLGRTGYEAMKLSSWLRPSFPKPRNSSSGREESSWAHITPALHTEYFITTHKRRKPSVLWFQRDNALMETGQIFRAALQRTRERLVLSQYIIYNILHGWD